VAGSPNQVVQALTKSGIQPFDKRSVDHTDTILSGFDQTF
jgi:hypothetical protein